MTKIYYSETHDSLSDFEAECDRQEAEAAEVFVPIYCPHCTRMTTPYAFLVEMEDGTMRKYKSCDLCREASRQYYAENKGAVLEKMIQTQFKCECGITLRLTNRANHEATNKTHRKYLAALHPSPDGEPPVLILSVEAARAILAEKKLERRAAKVALNLARPRAPKPQIKVTCECGKTFTKKHHGPHMLTKHHRLYVLSQPPATVKE